jgi:PEP-CTERM/exosortase A-associated glycosyltransferase
MRLAKRQKIDVLHAHSPALNGLASARAARRLGLPWVYEVRYFEEDAAVDRGKMTAGSPGYRMLQRMEMHALERAFCAITISEGIGRDLISRGIHPEKIEQVPNGVDTRYFSPQPPDADLIARFGLAGSAVIGFIGSFYLYEGLEYLIDAMSLLLARRRNVKALLAGEGEIAESLRRRIPETYRDHFIFAGKVPHEEVRRYYSVMDVVAYPRIRSRLTELTTPLKPLEAMSMERLVVGSNIGGIRELLAGGKAGIVFEADNPRDLADCLFRFVEDRSQRRAIGKAAREFVVRERDWDRVVARYPEIYGRAIEEREYSL